jgi:hypothetical protein
MAAAFSAHRSSGRGHAIAFIDVVHGVGWHCCHKTNASATTMRAETSGVRNGGGPEHLA